MKRRELDDYTPVVMKRFGEKLLVLRKERKMSQDELGEILGIGGRLISRYECAKTVPSLSTLRKIAELFNTTTDYLLFDEVDRASVRDPELLKQFQRVDKKGDKERDFIKKLIDALTLDDRLKNILEEKTKEPKE